MSGSIRLFVEAALSEGAEIVLAPAQAHYLGTVMRRMAGAPLALFNGRDGEWRARVGAIRRERATAIVEERTRPQAPGPDLWLAFALLKRDATDLVAEKATELGAAALLPVISARTQSPRVNLARLAAIATEAAEQCERLTVPRIEPPRRLTELLGAWPCERGLFVALARAAAPPPPAAPARAALLVGPEGGFSAEELDALGRHPFVIPVSLGPRVLRAETASIVGLALLQAHR